MKTRLISLLLAFSMALTFLPVGAVSAFAAETGSNELDLTSNDEVKITETATYDLLPSENAQGHLVIDAPGLQNRFQLDSQRLDPDSIRCHGDY